MKTKKPLKKIEAVVHADIYEKVYSIKDLLELFELFNTVHRDCMKINVKKIKEK